MEIMINIERIKSLRLDKSWSQEKLAAISGLSLRTVQRIEQTGNASLESKLALASAFDVSPESLTLPSSSKSTPSKYIPSVDGKLGFVGALTGLVCAYIGISIPLFIGAIDAGTAGFLYGGFGAFIGICAAIVGITDQRMQSKTLKT
jgi:transcriptional regulator with XRE-family HTH domain